MALSPNFNQVEVDLGQFSFNSPTSLQFGHDNRLYVSRLNGLIYSFSLTAKRDDDGNIIKFEINESEEFEEIDLVQNIPNHDDDGTLNTTLNRRQVTGLVVTEGTNGETVLYVSSSDPRIGGGFNSNNRNLDTNSGIISRLTKTTNGEWEKVDLIIGLPRSEENHSTNGLDIRTEIVDGEPRQIMYVVSGGNTNKGAPSNNFVWSSEYYYSAAVLRIDLTQLEQIEATEGLKGGTNYVDPYIYALPTLNDPTRPDNPQGQDTAIGTTGLGDAEAADTFGGNNGLNQAKYDPDGPVQIYSMGYRNSYDLVITKNNNIYTFDNGPNNGWGDIPLEANGITPIFNNGQVATNYPNINIDTGNDTDPDNLHLVTQGFYAGHPNPVYASGAAAGLYAVDTSTDSPIVTQLTDSSNLSNDQTTVNDDLPSDWNEIAGNLTYSEAGVYVSPGINPDGTNKGADGSLVTINSSSNGLTEYFAGTQIGSYPITDIPGAEVLAVVSFNGNIYFMEIVGDGTQEETNLTDISSISVGGTPLDVTVGIEEFKDSLFIAHFGGNNITALVPGTLRPTDIDKDNDGLADNIDPLQYDPDNGTNTELNPGETLFWDFNPADSGIHPSPSGEYNIGMTGWMVNGSRFLENEGIPSTIFSDPPLVDLDNTIRGGAPGIIQVKTVTAGNLKGTSNDQQDAMQTGFFPGSDVSKFTIKVPIFNPFTSDANSNITFSESASMGFSLGDGTMSNWVGIVVGAGNSSDLPVKPQVSFIYEENDNLINNLSIDVPDLLNAVDDDRIELFLTVDTETSEIIPSWRYEIENSWSAITQLGNSPVQLNSQGSIVEALQGQHFINNIQSSPVVSLISTAEGSQGFTADFLDLAIATPKVLVEKISTQTDVLEEGLIETYSLALTTQPTSEVTVTLSPDSQIAVDKTEIVFRPTNWAQPQTVTFGAKNDRVVEGNHVGQITHQITTNDNDYAQVSVPNLVVNIVDNDEPVILYRINVGGEEVASTDGSNQDWSADTKTNPSSFRIGEGGNRIYSIPHAISLSDPTLPANFPDTIFNTERWHHPSTPNMKWEFPVEPGSQLEVRLYLAEIYQPLFAPQKRVFDVSVEGVIPAVFNDIDQYQIAEDGRFILSHTVTVNDDNLSLEFLRNLQNPALKAIEIIDLDGSSEILPQSPPTITTADAVTIVENQTEVVDVNGIDVDEDPQNSNLTYGLIGGVDQEIFTINAETGVLSFITAPDFENPTDSDLDNIYEVEVAVTDSTGLSDTQLIRVTVTDEEPVILYRINVGGEEVASTDGSNQDWSADTKTNPSSFRIGEGGNRIYNIPHAINLTDPTLPANFPDTIFNTERWHHPSTPNMKWEFPVEPGSQLEVRLYLAEIYQPLFAPQKRVFDVSVEGVIPAVFNDIDQYQIAEDGRFILSHTVTVNDDNLSLEFLRNLQNPALKAIEIIDLDGSSEILPQSPPTITTADAVTTVENQTEVVDVNGIDIDEDPQNSNLTYGLIGGIDQEIFTINAETGVLSFITAPDFENPTDSDLDNIYEVEVAVTDSTGLSDTQLIRVTVTDDVTDNETGEAILTISLNSNNNVQTSTFIKNSFQLTNTGQKKIAQVDIDVTNAFYSGTVFDPFGVAGDTVSKPLTIDSDGNTGVVRPSNEAYIGDGGNAGYKGLRIAFDEEVNSGFESGETLSFSVDMDSNSIAGANKRILESGTDPFWDVGGVSGAELIGSTFTVTFTDGTAATGQLQGVANQGGSQGLASQESPNLLSSLTVNGLGAGEVGTYDDNGLRVIVSGPTGQTARVVLTKGFIQPVTNEFFNGNLEEQNYASILQAQLDTLAASDFPANNAVEFQTVDIVLTGEDQDISDQFDLSGVSNYDFAQEDRLPIGLVASVIDPTNDNLPIGPVTQPIYLQFTRPIENDSPPPPITIEAEAADIITGYRLQNLSTASGTQVLSFLGSSPNEQGSAVFIFNGPQGIYDIIVGTFDENDGLARFVLELNDVETGTTTEIGTLELNKDLGSNLANAQTFITSTGATGVNLTPGDTITVNGFEDLLENTRFDFIQFNPIVS